MSNNFATLLKVKENIEKLSHINQEKILWVFDLISHHIKITYKNASLRILDKETKNKKDWQDLKNEMVSLNIIMSQLYNANYLNSGTAFQILVDDWARNGIMQGNQVIDSTDFSIEDLSDKTNVLMAFEKLRMLFNTQKELILSQNKIIGLEEPLKEKYFREIYMISQYSSQNDNRMMNLREDRNEPYVVGGDSGMHPQPHNKEIYDNFNILEEISFIYGYYNNMRVGPEKSMILVNLTPITKNLVKIVKWDELQSIITNINSCRNKSFNYLNHNKQNFMFQIYEIFPKVSKILDKPQESSAKLSEQLKFFNTNIENLKTEIKEHILTMKDMRKKTLKVTTTQNNNNAQYNAQLLKHVTAEGGEETVWTEFWNLTENTELSKSSMDYNVKELIDKLISLFNIQLRHDFVLSLNIIKPKLDKKKDKGKYLHKAIQDVEKILNYYDSRDKDENKTQNIITLADRYGINLSFKHLQYETELLKLMSNTLKQFQSLYNTSLKLKPEDIYLRDISKMNEAGYHTSGTDYKGLEIQYTEKYTEKSTKLLYHDNVFPKVKTTLMDFHLMFVKYRLTFFENSEGLKMLNDVSDIKVEIELSSSNLLTLSNVELEFNAISKLTNND
jgi:hypothetical protein